jgi:hypothetical protein
MKYKSPLISKGSGSVAGCVFSRNRFGPYIRNRTVPTNPGTLPQTGVRTRFSNLATRWKMTLTDMQRQSWNEYATQVPKIDTLGDPIFLTGFNWYVGVNTLRQYAAGSIIDQGPTTFNHTVLSPVSLLADATADEFTIVFTNTDEWATAVGGFLFAFVGGPTNFTRFFYKGPFTYLATVNGAVVPPTSPATASYDGITANMKYWMRFIASSADGRLSVPQITMAIATI